MVPKLKSTNTHFFRVRHLNSIVVKPMRRIDDSAIEKKREKKQKRTTRSRPSARFLCRHVQLWYRGVAGSVGRGRGARVKTLAIYHVAANGSLAPGIQCSIRDSLQERSGTLSSSLTGGGRWGKIFKGGGELVPVPSRGLPWVTSHSEFGLLEVLPRRS